MAFMIILSITDVVLSLIIALRLFTYLFTSYDGSQDSHNKLIMNQF